MVNRPNESLFQVYVEHGPAEALLRLSDVAFFDGDNDSAAAFYAAYTLFDSYNAIMNGEESAQ
jgi:hypothetical protein